MPRTRTCASLCANCRSSARTAPRPPAWPSRRPSREVRAVPPGHVFRRSGRCAHHRGRGQKVGLDMERARRVAASPTVEAEISRSMELAQRLGFSGTPSWVAGDKLIPGAVGFDQLSQAVDAARGG
ncbi:DsbA family protein [Novosphingobium panipatense]|uniref:DsbA family protein n=1 Tax=Novosphingobium panipatense TaxID=428991 RepID=UPI003608CFBE